MLLGVHCRERADISATSAVPRFGSFPSPSALKYSITTSHPQGPEVGLAWMVCVGGSRNSSPAHSLDTQRKALQKMDKADNFITKLTQCLLLKHIPAAAGLCRGPGRIPPSPGAIRLRNIGLIFFNLFFFLPPSLPAVLAAGHGLHPEELRGFCPWVVIPR